MVLTRGILMEINRVVSEAIANALSSNSQVLKKLIDDVGESIAERTEMRLKKYETEMQSLREENAKLQATVDEKTDQAAVQQKKQYPHIWVTRN